MANRWKGNLVANAATSSSTDYTGKANGAWGLNNQLQQKQSGLWPRGIGAPQVPTNVSAGATETSIIVNFTTGYTGGGDVTYTATSTPSGITATNSISPITVTGVTPGTSYTFTVRGSNTLGYTSAESAPSNPVTLVIEAVAFSMTNAPYIQAYSWGRSGFGSKFSDITTPSFAISATEFAYDNSAVLVSTSLTPYVAAFRWSNGFGTQYSNPASSPSGVNSYISRFCPDMLSVCMGQDTTPFTTAYAWSSSTGFGSKYANPSSTLAGLSRGLSFNPFSNSVIFSHNVSPTITAYAWSSSTGFGSKYANPVDGLSGNALSVDFNPATGTTIGVSHVNAPGIAVYDWSAGFGTKYANPSVDASSLYNRAVQFANNGNSIAYCPGDVPYVAAYPWSAGFGTKYANPSVLTGDVNISMAFSSSSSEIAVANLGSPPITAYRYSSSGFGAKFTNPATIPAVRGDGIAFTH